MTDGHEEIETALLLEKATQIDLATINPSYENAVAFTDGKRTFINSDDRLSKILPAYDKGMLKWLLWHEEYHKQLRHHNRFYKYLDELRAEDTFDEFHVTKNEVNIIMDILVHDSLSKMFPELVETAIANLAQMRNRNSLGYTFKTFTLEEMLDEYKKHKRGEDSEEGGSGDRTPEGETEESEDTEDSKSKDSKSKDSKGEKSKDKDSKEDKPEEDKDTEEKEEDEPSKAPEDADKKGHSEDHDHSEGMSTKDMDGKDEEEPEVGGEEPEDKKPSEPELPDEHDKTDWSKLDDRNETEFIDKDDGDEILRHIEKLKKKKIKLARITETLNGLATSQRARSFAVPSYIKVNSGVILKGRKPAKTPLYIIFDASGSMGAMLETFKEIISKSIPQAMNCPCEWFSGCNNAIAPYKRDCGDGYYKGKFKDIMKTWANNGFSDDGDRVIDLCLEAEKHGYSPIGVTDGGGCLRHINELKKLQRTILVGQNEDWLEIAKEYNPKIQTLYVD